MSDQWEGPNLRFAVRLVLVCTEFDENNQVTEKLIDGFHIFGSSSYNDTATIYDIWEGAVRMMQSKFPSMEHRP